MPKKTKADPTGQSQNRKKALKKLQNKSRTSKNKIIRRFRDIPRKRRRQKIISNDSRLLYDYDFGNENELRVDVKEIIEQEFQTSLDNLPNDWFFIESVETPYRQASAEQVVETNRMIEQAAILGLIPLFAKIEIDIGSYLRSSSYAERINRLFRRNYSQMSDLVDRFSSQVSREIIEGIGANLTPSQIVESVRGRFETMDSSLARTVSTEVNRAYTDGVMESSKDLASQVGVNVGVQHISALLPTTRDHHAARHRLYFTVEDQNAWWNEGANRINCHCSVRSVLLDNRGEPVNREE